MLGARRELQETREAVEELEKRLERLERRCQQEVREIEEELEAELTEVERSEAARLSEVQGRYRNRVNEMIDELDRLQRGAGTWAAPWDDDRWSTWTPAPAPPPLVRFGELEARTPAGASDDDAYDVLGTPALLPFLGGRGVTFVGRGEALDQATATVRSLVLRLLAEVPPGKLRLLLLDPEGMGENLAEFMGLKEHLSKLVGGRIWVERSDIDEQLADLSSHMQTVIQSFLQGRFDSLEAYNREAAEIAEPYRLLVALNFPTHFSPEAARRLAGFAAKGPRCGIFPIITLDAAQDPPRGFETEQIRRPCEVVEHGEEGWTWKDEVFGGADLTLDDEPPGELMLDLVDRIGRAAAGRDEVKLPYESVQPSPEEWWEGDASDGLEVPLGRAGARDLLTMELGGGTAQHALVAGRTGSGKSTLLHVLVTGLAFRYSPEELQLYLIDFKKGVEFKDYASRELPHARAVAIESDREFGLSVLRGLVEEMERRGDLFRDAGTDELAAYRREAGERLPRILLLVDEFQHFFLEDDQKAHVAARLLDRLVREGRAFGIHILLGSQSLSGARSISRSTMDQMSVRIALQCSAADSELILSAGNPAARLLNRPGDAFYNDQAGAKGGNERFQVAWLDDAERRSHLDRVAEMARERGMETTPPVVFEGGRPAVLEEDAEHPVVELVEAARWPARGDWAPPAWLGEPVAIRPPTRVEFTADPGKNLLVVSRAEEAVRGMFTGALLGLVLHHPPADARFHCVDWSGELARAGGTLAAVKEAFPHRIEFHAARDFSALLDRAIAELERREAEGDGGPPKAATRRPVLYLILGSIGRCRALRRDDGYGYGTDSGSGPTERLTRLLRDGPPAGLHTLCWAATQRGLEDALGRGAEEEFGFRVATAMDERASSELLGGVEASRLGQHRALLYDEDSIGQLQKFRPYRKPATGWIREMAARVRANRPSGRPDSAGEE